MVKKTVCSALVKWNENQLELRETYRRDASPHSASTSCIILSWIFGRQFSTNRHGVFWLRSVRLENSWKKRPKINFSKSSLYNDGWRIKDEGWWRYVHEKTEFLHHAARMPHLQWGFYTKKTAVFLLWIIGDFIPFIFSAPCTSKLYTCQFLKSGHIRYDTWNHCSLRAKNKHQLLRTNDFIRLQSLVTWSFFWSIGKVKEIYTICDRRLRLRKLI